MMIYIVLQLEPSIMESVAGCLARFSSMMVTCGVAALSLLAISYDRFLAIAGNMAPSLIHYTTATVRLYRAGGSPVHYHCSNC